MTADRPGSAVIEFPNDLDVVITREFDAPIDLRVGGDYHFIMVTDDGTECSFRGTLLEVEPPTRIAQTWVFDRWPGVEAVESMDLHETDGGTKVTYRLAFGDQAGRDHMTKELVQRTGRGLERDGEPGDEHCSAGRCGSVASGLLVVNHGEIRRCRPSRCSSGGGPSWAGITSTAAGQAQKR